MEHPSQMYLLRRAVLNAQVQVNTIESALAKAESNIANASDGLNLLMNGGDDSKSQLYITDSLEQKSNLEVSPECVPSFFVKEQNQHY